MPLKMTKLPNEPIIIATITGILDTDVVSQMYRQTNEIMAQLGLSKVYRISDYTEANISFADLLRVTALAGTDQPGSANDPRITPLFVGTDAMVRLGADVLRQRQVNIQIFRTINDALDAIRLQMMEQ
jgi:hypothetical protein